MLVTVLGATGHTGAFVVRALTARGVRVRACGRRVAALAGLAEVVDEVREVDASVRAEVRAALRDAAGVVNLAGPFGQVGHAPVEAAIDAGVPYVDTTGEQAFMLSTRDRQHEAAQQAGVAVVNAMAYEYSLSDLAVATHLSDGGDALHVLYRSRRAAPSAGTKKSMLRVMAAPGFERRDGALHGVPTAAHHHTFTTEDGPRSGVSFPGGEPLTIPEHADFRTIRVYAPSKPNRVKAARHLGRVAPFVLRGPVLRFAERRVDRRHKGPDNAKATGEVIVEADDGRALTVHTPDPYLTTGELAAEGIKRLIDDPRASGVVAPAVAMDAAGVLAALEARLDGFRVEVRKA